jgi:hypothetical protein
MKRLLTTAAVALSMTTAAQAANHTIMFASNYWRVTHIARNNDGNPMCMMSSQISFPGGATGSVMIKLVKGSPFIHLTKTNWQFPTDMQVPFSINLDNGRHEFFGTSKKFPNFKFNFIVTNVLKDEADNGWLDDFASSETMTINFRNGNEPRWSVKMAGSRDASKSFQSCIKTLAENAATSPQATPTSPVPDVPDGSSQPAPTNPVQTVPIKKPKGDSI